MKLFDTAIGLSVNATVPVLVTVNVCAWLVVPATWAPKISNEGDTASPGLTPWPARLTVCVPAPSFMVTVPLSGPAVVGVKTTLTLQLPPAAIEPEQLVVLVK
jgi:hypothetical protein